MGVIMSANLADPFAEKWLLSAKSSSSGNCHTKWGIWYLMFLLKTPAPPNTTAL